MLAVCCDVPGVPAGLVAAAVSGLARTAILLVSEAGRANPRATFEAGKFSAGTCIEIC